MIEKYLSDYGFGKKAIDKVLVHIQKKYTEENMFIRMKENVQFLENYGFSREAIIKIFSSNVYSFHKRASNNEGILSHLESFGIARPTLRKLLKRSPSLLNVSIEKFNRMFEKFRLMEMSDEEIVKILLSCPNLFLSERKVDSVLDWLYSWWPKKEDVKRIILRAPSSITRHPDSLEDKMQWFLGFGLDRMEVAKAVLVSPQILTMGMERFERRVKILESANFSHEEIKNILIEYPAIMALKEDTLLEKITFLCGNGFQDVIVKRPKYLMQNVRLTKARVNFLRYIGQDSAKNYSTLVFIGNRQFENKFKIERSTLLDLFSSKEKEY